VAGNDGRPDNVAGQEAGRGPVTDNLSGDENQLEAQSDDQLIERIVARGNVPRHVAIIMDGNGRWAQKRFLPRVAGHRAGRHAVRRAVRMSRRLGIKALTLYTFSQENFKRPAQEVEALWLFLRETLASERDELARNNVRLLTSGELQYLPDQLQKAIAETVAMLAGNDGLLLNLALAYGGRQEILKAASAVARRVQAGEILPDEITEADFSRELYTPDLPDPDLVIRTSGESRLSNFLLWQSAYSELLITPVLWPDFRERDLLLAVVDYQGRQRRFGCLPTVENQDDLADTKSILDPARWRRLLRVRP